MKIKDAIIWLLAGMVISALLCMKIIPREVKVDKPYLKPYPVASKPDTVYIKMKIKPSADNDTSKPHSWTYDGDGYFVIGDTDFLQPAKTDTVEKKVSVYPVFGINTNLGLLYDNALDFSIGAGFSIKKNRLNYNMLKPLSENRVHQILYERNF